MAKLIKMNVEFQNTPTRIQIRNSIVNLLYDKCVTSFQVTLTAEQLEMLLKMSNVLIKCPNSNYVD